MNEDIVNALGSGESLGELILELEEVDLLIHKTRCKKIRCDKSRYNIMGAQCSVVVEC